MEINNIEVRQAVALVEMFVRDNRIRGDHLNRAKDALLYLKVEECRDLQGRYEFRMALNHYNTENELSWLQFYLQDIIKQADRIREMQRPIRKGGPTRKHWRMAEKIWKQFQATAPLQNKRSPSGRILLGSMSMQEVQQRERMNNERRKELCYFCGKSRHQAKSCRERMEREQRHEEEARRNQDQAFETELEELIQRFSSMTI